MMINDSRLKNMTEKKEDHVLIIQNNDSRFQKYDGEKRGKMVINDSIFKNMTEKKEDRVLIIQNNHSRLEKYEWKKRGKNEKKWIIIHIERP